MNGAKRRKVEFIAEPKERTSRFIKRKKGLIKKANELSVLCGVDCCVIIMNEKNNNYVVDLVWSSSNDNVVVGDLICKYREECCPKRVYKVENTNKRNREGFQFPSWNSKFESINEYELRNLAGDLEMKLDKMKYRRELMMKNKRVKTVIYDSPGPSFIQDNDSCNLDMNPVVVMNSLDQAIVMDHMEVAMNSIQDNDRCNLDMNPVPAMDSLDQAIVMDQMKVLMNSIENNDSCNPLVAMDSLDQAIVMNQMKAVMNSIENNDSCNLDMNQLVVMDSLAANDSCNLQPIAMIELDNVNEMMPTLDDITLTDLQQQYLYDPSHPFVNYNSGAHTEADAFSDSFLMSPAVISTDVWETSDYDWNVFDFSLSDCFSMQEAYACGNSQLENCLPRQSFDCPPLPPLSTNGHVSSEMQSFQQQGLLYNFE